MINVSPKLIKLHGIWLEDLSDLKWKLFEDVMTEEGEKREQGMPHAHFRHVLNTLMALQL